MMQFVFENLQSVCEEAITKYGSAPEHNFHHFLDYGEDAKAVPFFAAYGEGKGLLCKKTGKKYIIFSDPLAPEEEHARIVTVFLENVFADPDVKRVEMELKAETRQAIVAALPPHLKAMRPKYYFNWPIFVMDEWTGDKMEGGDWKDIRYYWNKFKKEHQIDIVPASALPKEVLHNIVDEWRKERSQRDPTECRYMHLAIDHEFAGFDHVRIMIVDGKPVAITAGFKIPNSNKYYSSIGIYGRSVDRLGIYCNMDDLIFLKQQGYKEVNFGGGDKLLTEFKMKFRPSYFYKTQLFDIVRA